MTEEWTLGRAGCSLRLSPTPAKSQSSPRTLGSASLALPVPLLPTPRVGHAALPTINAGLLSQRGAPLGVALAKPGHCTQGKCSAESLLCSRPRAAQVAEQGMAGQEKAAPESLSEVAGVVLGT